MATRTINTKITVSGEKEYKQAISEMNSGLSVLNSEMKKVTAQYQDNADSVEALKAKNDVLERTLISQKEKVEELRKALAYSVEQYGEADARTMKWQASLNNAEAQVYNTEAAIRANTEAMEQAGKSGEGLGTILDSISSKLGINVPDGAKKALDGIGNFSAKSVIAVGAVTAAVAGLVETYKQLVQMTVESASVADNILTMSQITGLTAESIQELQYSSELIDVSFETIKSSLTKLKRSMEDAQSGNEELGDTFERLGIRINDTEGNFRTAESVFYDVIDALGHIENVTDRDTVAMNLFGKKAEDLNPLIIQGSETLREYADEAHRVSAVLSGEQLAALGAVDDAYQRLQLQQNAITAQISVQMAPAVEKFYTSWTTLISEAGQALVDSKIIENLALLMENGAKILDFIIESERQVPILTTALNGLSAILGAIAQFCSLIADAADLIGSLFTLNFSGVANALGFGYSSGNANNYQRTYMQQQGTWDQYAQYYGIDGNASGDYNFEGGWTRINENGPEMAYLPQGTTILNAQETREATGDIYNITIDAKDIQELNDIIRIMKYSRVTERMRGTT